MKSINLIMSVLLLQLMLWYGYSWSMTVDGFFIQGWFGTALPGLCYVAGWIYGNIHQKL